jgi:hypothetical protein
MQGTVNALNAKKSSLITVGIYCHAKLHNSNLNKVAWLDKTCDLVAPLASQEAK